MGEGDGEHEEEEQLLLGAVGLHLLSVSFSVLAAALLFAYLHLIRMMLQQTYSNCLNLRILLKSQVIYCPPEHLSTLNFHTYTYTKFDS